jgi:hypothetical protein
MRFVPAFVGGGDRAPLDVDWIATEQFVRITPLTKSRALLKVAIQFPISDCRDR